MPRGDKSSYSSKQKRQAQHIEASEKAQGRSTQAAERIAWATVNKQDGGAKGKPAAKKATRKTTTTKTAASKTVTKKAVAKKAATKQGTNKATKKTARG